MDRAIILCYEANIDIGSDWYIHMRYACYEYEVLSSSM